MDLPNLGWHILIKFVLSHQYDGDEVVRNVEIQRNDNKRNDNK